MSGPTGAVREQQGKQEREALLTRLRELLHDEPI